MLQYLVILLDDTSTSFCHYQNSKAERCLIPLETLSQGIRFGMIENLMIQFVYPDYELPQKYRDEIDTIDHNKIVSSQSLDKTVLEESDVIVLHDWTILQNTYFGEGKSYVLRTDKQGLFEKYSSSKVSFTIVHSTVDDRWIFGYTFLKKYDIIYDGILNKLIIK